MEHTPDQKRAIEIHNQNLIVVAGAGSGKTRVLVDRYLALLEANPDWPLNALVAITFTRKAAGEMRDRVRSALQDRLQKAADKDKARWSNLLATMDGARIDTIHGLCASILRANAAEAKIDPGFSVLDETEAGILLDDVIDATLQDLVAEGDPTVRLFTEYDQRTIHDALAQSELLARNFPPLPDDLLAHWLAQWEQDARQFLMGFLYFIDHDAETFDPIGSDKLSEHWQNCLNALDKLTDTRTLQEAIETVGDIAAIKNVRTNKDWGAAGEAAKEAITAIRDQAKASLEAIGAPPTSELDQRAAELLPLWLTLMQRVQVAYQQAKQDQSLLDFTDLENRTRDLLTNEQADVRARYQGAEFKHLLVDEFQDTNADQWQIIQALANLNEPGSLFVVGDPKQSIYQFRGADVSVFEDVQKQIIDTGGIRIPLAESFRTHKPLVACFNDLFGKLLVRDEQSPVKDFQVTLGDPMISNRSAPDDSAPVLECLVIDSSQKRVGDDTKLSTAEARQWEAYEIAQRLKTLVAEEVRIWDKKEQKHRPVNYGDMALLFQATTQITLYEEVFKAQGLPFVTIAGRGYYSRQEVWDMLNLLRALHNPADNLSLAAVLRSPLFNLSDDTLLALRLQKDANNRPIPLWQALEQPAGVSENESTRVAFARECLDELHKSAGRVTIAELLRLALVRTGYLATLTALPDGARRRGNVEKLIEKAEASGKITLGAFTEYLDDLSIRESREGEAALETKGAITLMTVHASKGLEFPVVVLADASWTRSGGGGSIIIPNKEDGLACKAYDTDANKVESPFSYRRATTRETLLEEAERKRLLYVAATRAQDYLLISGQCSRSETRGFSVKGWLGQIWNLLELDEEIIPQRDPIMGTYDWGSLRLAMPDQIPDREQLILGEANEESAWESTVIRTGEALPGSDQMPLLLNPVNVEPDAPARHLSATQIADIGAAHLADEEDRVYYRNRIRQRIFYDAPAHIPTVTEQAPIDDTTVPKHKIGEMVHEVLRYWRFPTAEDDLTDLLESYAWKQGIINPTSRQSAIRQAQRLLTGFVGTKVYNWVKEAQQLGQPIYYELPFIYRTEKRTIHGIIDLLFQRSDGVWVIVDYKTSFVKTASASKIPSGDEIAIHARRYHLQIGVYAAAVQAQLGDSIPETYIHYIRYSRAIPIATEDWREALTNLENLIGSIV